MQSGREGISLIERLALVAIILFAAAIGIQNLLHSIKESEEHTIDAAAVEYSMVRKMYAEPYHVRYSGAAPMNTNGPYTSYNKPIN